MTLSVTAVKLIQDELAKLPARSPGSLPQAVQDLLRNSAPEATGEVIAWIQRGLGADAPTALMGSLPVGMSYVAAADFVSALERAEVEHQKAALDLLGAFSTALLRALLAAL